MMRSNERTGVLARFRPVRTAVPPYTPLVRVRAGRLSNAAATLDTLHMGFEWISMTTDYGVDDGFVAVCKGVIARLAPHVRTIDITHTVPPQDVRRGASVLAQTAPYLPPAVHLAVIDPGVGTSRRGLVLVAGGSMLVGPDNGLLVPAADSLGEIESGYELANPEYWLPSVSPTFHGRDVFAPVAAHLASGVPPDKLGPPVEPSTRMI